MDKLIIIYFIFFILFVKIKSGNVQIIDNTPSESKYNDYYYLSTYRIPIEKMRYKSNGSDLSIHPLRNAFDDDFNTYWESFQGQEDNFLNDIEVTFSSTVIIDRMVYQAPSNSNYQGVGYPSELKVYYKLKNDKGGLESDFLLVDDIISETTGNRVVFLFDDEIVCDQIKIVWAYVEPTDESYTKAKANEIIFLAPENEEINKILFDVFDKNDYIKLNINEKYNNLNAIDEIEEKLEKYLDIYSNARFLLLRAKKIIKGEIKYEKKREFTTNPLSDVNIINQHGDVESYSRNILKMSRGGTNKQSTGIFGFANETITIFVDSNNGDPLPAIRFTQYVGLYNKWIDKPIQLKRGLNILTVKEFDISEIKLNIPPGGPIYIENKYTPDEQSQNIKVYIEDGTLFPYFRLGEDENIFKEALNEYVINLSNKTINNNYDICELYSDKVTITVNASYAQIVYNIDDESPQENLLTWNKLMKYFLIFEGIQFEEKEQYYDPKNEFINLHIRYSTNHKGGIAAYAFDDHIGIFNQDYFRSSLTSYKSDEGIGRSLVHEIGHMIDVKPREYAEITNCVLEEYAVQTIYKKFYNRERQETLYEALAPDNIDNSLRFCYKENCIGFFDNAGTYVYNQYIWWNIESFYPGYWRTFNNLYRFNSSLTDRMNKNEAMVYYTSLILGYDTGYYFERFGLAMIKGRPFKISSASLNYNNTLKEAIEKGKISNNTMLYKKLWYADDDQYNFTILNGTGCYYEGNKYDIKINYVTKVAKNTNYISFPNIDCESHLGFEVIENGTIIGFTQRKSFIDKNIYPEDYIPKYKIVAYDRLLNNKESDYMYLMP